MPKITPTPLSDLTMCQQLLASARREAEAAADALSDARATRACELAAMVDDAWAFCQRLAFAVEAGQSSDERQECIAGLVRLAGLVRQVDEANERIRTLEHEGDRALTDLAAVSDNTPRPSKGCG